MAFSCADSVAKTGLPLNEKLLQTAHGGFIELFLSVHDPACTFITIKIHGAKEDEQAHSDFLAVVPPADSSRR